MVVGWANSGVSLTPPACVGRWWWLLMRPRGVGEQTKYKGRAVHLCFFFLLFLSPSALPPAPPHNAPPDTFGRSVRLLIFHGTAHPTLADAGQKAYIEQCRRL